MESLDRCFCFYIYVDSGEFFLPNYRLYDSKDRTISKHRPIVHYAVHYAILCNILLLQDIQDGNRVIERASDIYPKQIHVPLRLRIILLRNKFTSIQLQELHDGGKDLYIWWIVWTVMELS